MQGKKGSNGRHQNRPIKFIHFKEPGLAASRTLQLKTTGQSIGEFPDENALATIEDPERLQRQLNRTGPKVVRRAGKSAEGDAQTEETDAEDQKLYIRLARGLVESPAESDSFVRDTTKKSDEDYRHNRIKPKKTKGRANKNKSLNASPQSPIKVRPRRSTRPTVSEYDYTPLEDIIGPEYPAEAAENVEAEKEEKRPKRKHNKFKVEEEEEEDEEESLDGQETEEELESEAGGNNTKKLPPKQPQIVNNDYCASCGGTGELLCCETCVRSFHFSCIEPPVMRVEEIPEEQWSCRKCVPRKIEDITEKERISKSFFGPIITQFESQNPLAFQLPSHIREMFSGVNVSKLGEYMDVPHKGEHSGSAGRVVDKSGNVRLCYQCKSSGINKPLAVCSECQIAWHVDCVNPPLESTPMGYWKCPLHVSSELDLPKRVKNPLITPVQLSREVPNNGDIEVFDDENDTDEESERTRASSKRSLVKNENSGNVNNKARRIDVSNDYEEEETVKHIISPVQTRLQPDGMITAKSQRHRPRGFEQDRVVYKIPATTVKFDFLDAVHNLRKAPLRETPSSQVMNALDILAERPQPECEAVRNLMSLKLRGPAVDTAQAASNLKVLIETALDDENEIGQITAIKKLMREKGKERLLQILSDA